jgi:hypothetical protein
MGVDERARHRLYRRLEEVLGAEEAGTLMNQLPPVGFTDLATKADLKSEMTALRSDLTAQIERMGRRLVMWTSSLVLAAAALAFTAGRLV